MGGSAAYGTGSETSMVVGGRVFNRVLVGADHLLARPPHPSIEPPPPAVLPLTEDR